MAYKLDDHNEKFSFMREYFKLTEVLLKDNGVIDYSFTCIKCLPTKKTLKTNSQAPTSNLKVHVTKIHPFLLTHLLIYFFYGKVLKNDIGKKY